MSFNELRFDQARQIADLTQVFETMREGRDRLAAHYRGTMRWKTIKGHEYLYRRAGVKDQSLGPRSPETEETKRSFDEGKAEATQIFEGARRRIEEMAPINRALGLGRVPAVAARIARRLDDEKLLGASISIVGTNSLYCYEAMAGGHFVNDLTSTEDIDFLFDSRQRIKIVSEELPAAGLMGIIQAVDSSFKKVSGGYRMVNKDNYLVDLIAPATRNVMKTGPKFVTPAEGDLVAAEIHGLEWLVNAPKVQSMSVDVRGFPVPMSCVDPRYYSIYKLWLSDVDGRPAAQRRRDRAQALAVAGMIAEHLPHLRFDDRALEALPKALRERADELLETTSDVASPDW